MSQCPRIGDEVEVIPVVDAIAGRASAIREGATAPAQGVVVAVIGKEFVVDGAQRQWLSEVANRWLL